MSALLDTAVIMPPRDAPTTVWRLAYAQIGWYTFPVHGIDDEGRCTCGKANCTASGKHPVYSGRERGATVDAIRIRKDGRKYPRANVAVHLGLSHLICLDVDPRNGGSETLQRLELTHGVLDTAIVAATGGDGSHRFFRQLENNNIFPKKGCLGRGIDVLHGNLYPVIAPSKHKSGKAYNWLPDCDPWGNGWFISTLPEWMLNESDVGRQSVKSDALECLGSMVNVDNGKAFVWTPGEVSRLRSALQGIPADEQKTWFWVGAALHHASSGGEEGRKLWDEWSIGSEDYTGCPEKYNPIDQQSKWQSFDAHRDGRATAASIFYEAKCNGWIDPQRSGPTEDEIDDMLAGSPDGDQWQEDRDRLYSPAECDDAPRRGHLIKLLIAPRDLICIFGPPGAGKSILAPYLSYTIALGKSAFGLRVRQNKVLYVAAEDLHGMRGRVAALYRVHGNTTDFWLRGPVDLLSEGSPDLTRLLAKIEELRPALIVIDTVAMAFPGLKENESHEMGRVVAVARNLTKWGAAVVLIHHDTKVRDGTPRGHSILNGAIDVAVCLDPADRSGIVRGRLTKNRNGPQNLQIAFRIETCDAGVDDDGDAIRLPYAVEVTSELPTRPKLTPSATAALKTLEEMALLSRASVLVKRWQETCELTHVVSDSGKRESRTKAFTRALKELEQKGAIGTSGSHAWPVTMPTLAPDFEPFEVLVPFGDDL